ncbi:MAG: TIR domain-containing protein, partial [Desulfobacterales bacterium]|nr:TIR domain-containing protein [Desulfobacterales bacterium]
MNSDFGNLPVKPMNYIIGHLDGVSTQANIIIAIAEDIGIKHDVLEQLRRHLDNQYIFHVFDYTKTDIISLPRFCRTIHGNKGNLSPCVFAFGLEQLKKNDFGKYNDAIIFLNNHREDIAFTNTSVILWTPPHVYADLSEQALDFMDWTYSAEFSLSEETAHLLEQRRRFEEMLARPNLRPALADNFRNQVQAIHQRLRDIRITGQDSDFQYDVFLSYATNDAEFVKDLAERLRDSGVKVWFDQWESDRWESEPGANRMVLLNQGLSKSRKMLAVWTSSYFKDEKIRTQAETFAQQHSDLLAGDRVLVPVLLEDCAIPHSLESILYIDFRITQDRDFKFRQVLEALDLFRDKFISKERPENYDRKHDFPEHGFKEFEPEKPFKEEVAALYRLLGFDVKNDAEISGNRVGLMLEQNIGGFRVQAVAECRNSRIDSNESDRILGIRNVVENPALRWIAVSSKGFAPEARQALEKADISCVAYSELLRDLVPLDSYVKTLISDYEDEVIKEKWEGNDWFIRPELETDITYEKHPALRYFGKWMGRDESNFLVILGDLGTGKTTLSRFLSYHLGLGFLSDPLRHPVPVLIPLKDVRKETSLESIIISHFSRYGLSELNFRRFEHLLRLRKIILFFDAFDEMADRVEWEITRSNFAELRRASDSRGKVVLTCRTHYFKDRTEQVRLIGVGPSLSDVETELYAELRQRGGAEVAYLQEFDNEKIRDYLRKVRPGNYEEDWDKIQSIHNLKDLAKRPLLLDMIVKSLPRIKEQDIDAANLYNVYTNIWIEREEKEKGRFLDRNLKRALMLELSWQMWNREKEKIHHRELAPFLAKFAQGRKMEWDDEERNHIYREMMAATFLRRDKGDGDFAFMHSSFMEFFLARRLHYTLSRGNIKAIHRILNTRRFDRKTIFFLTLLDKKAEKIVLSLQNILTGTYTRNVSENALQILYWGARIGCGMEDKICNVEELKKAVSARIPKGAQLQGAFLEETVLEGVNLTDADLTDVNLRKANLNNAILTNANLDRANLEDIKLTGAEYKGASFKNAKGDSFAQQVDISGFRAIVQRGHGSNVETLAYSPDGSLIASAGGEGVIFIWQAEKGKILFTLEGHTSGVRSVNFSPDGTRVASGSYDKTVRLWDADNAISLHVLHGHTSGVTSVNFS